MTQQSRIRYTLSSIVLGASVLMLTACAARQPTSPAAPATAVPSPTPEDVCTVISPEPTPQPSSLLPPESEEDFVLGPKQRLVTIVEYCDFQAPICRSMAAVIGNILNAHPDDVRFIFRPIALAEQLDKSELALHAALAAGRQAKFWEMYDQLFLRGDEWADLAPEEFATWLRTVASELGLRAEEFSSDLDSEEVRAEAAARFAAAAAIGNLRLPFLLVNGQPQPTFAIDSASVNAAVELILLSKRQFTDCPPLTIDSSREYMATLHTERGDVVIELLANVAPLAVNSFVFLARSGWFDGVTFHRVIAGFVAQTGDPSGTGRGNPGYFFRNENADMRFDQPGLVAMANSGPDTNGSQFFITFAPAPHLSGGYTIFGRVLDGLEVVETLTLRNPEDSPSPPPGDLLLDVEITEK